MFLADKIQTVLGKSRSDLPIENDDSIDTTAEAIKLKKIFVPIIENEN